MIDGTESLEAVLSDARRLGLLGPDPIERHLSHARAWAAVLEPQGFLDLGSGAGLPGLVLANCWPDRAATLLDSQVTRTAWLRTAVVRLGMQGRVTVVEGRAEDLGRQAIHREQYPLVVARAFGPPAVTAEYGAAFTSVGGYLSVSEPPDAGDRWPKAPLERLGLGNPRQIVHEGASFVILTKDTALDESFPRRRNRSYQDPLW